MTAFKRAGRGAGAVAAIPIAQSSKRRLRGAWHRIMEVMLGDEVQRAAKAHCHQSFANVPIRLAAFRTAPESVQIVARMMLLERIERRASGNAAPATTGLVATVATAATLIGALFLGLFNAYFGQIGAGVQPTAAGVTSMIQATAGPVSLVALVLVVIGLVVCYRARSRDRERAMSAAWLSVYEVPAVDESRPAAFGSIWNDEDTLRRQAIEPLLRWSTGDPSYPNQWFKSHMGDSYEGFTRMRFAAEPGGAS